ncbi:MAG: hypothetical protein WBD41_07940 [Rhodococcus sp. (in: high G+C Gram-positive bacteria)]
MWLIFVVAGLVAVAVLVAVLRDPDSVRAQGYAPSSYEARVLRGEVIS